MANGKRKEFNIVDELKKDGIGPTSWKDLTDKPFGKKTETAELIPEQTITGTADYNSYCTAWVLPFDLTHLGTPEAAQKFLDSEKIITVDGTEYRGKLTLDSSGAFVDANGDAVVLTAKHPTDPDTLAPLSMSFDGTGSWALVASGLRSDDWNIVVSVTGEVTTVTPIDPDYLSEGAFKVTFSDDGDGHIISSATASDIQEAIMKGRHVTLYDQVTHWGYVQPVVVPLGNVCQLFVMDYFTGQGQVWLYVYRIGPTQAVDQVVLKNISSNT